MIKNKISKALMAFTGWLAVFLKDTAVMAPRGAVGGRLGGHGCPCGSEHSPGGYNGSGNSDSNLFRRMRYDVGHQEVNQNSE